MVWTSFSVPKGGPGIVNSCKNQHWTPNRTQPQHYQPASTEKTGPSRQGTRGNHVHAMPQCPKIDLLVQGSALGQPVPGVPCSSHPLIHCWAAKQTATCQHDSWQHLRKYTSHRRLTRWQLVYLLVTLLFSPLDCDIPQYLYIYIILIYIIYDIIYMT